MTLRVTTETRFEAKLSLSIGFLGRAFCGGMGGVFSSGLGALALRFRLGSWCVVTLVLACFDVEWILLREGLLGRRSEFR